MLFVLQGPSGSGKTTQAAHLAREKKFEKIIPATTRPPRAGEIHGRDYYFLDEKTYDARLVKRREEDRFDKEHFNLQCDATLDASGSEEAVFSELVAVIETAIRERKK